MNRENTIIRTSIVGIAVNVVLAAFKAAVGLVAGSIAVILDAVNNLGDALSSVITIVGTKLAGRRPDRKHPYGYGRIEYLTSVIIAVIVLLAGVTALRESVDKIIHPQAAEYTAVSLIVIAAAVIAKLLVGRYVKGVGRRVNAQSLIASGSDALFDAILSAATLAGAAVSMIWGVSLEGWLGAVISLVIIKAGIEMLLETLNSIIGTRADSELTGKLKETIASVPGVRGVYDLTLHNYGPTRSMGSVHVEVDDTLTAREIHELTRGISEKVYMEYGIVLTAGIYASNTEDGTAAEIRKYIDRLMPEFPQVLQTHGLLVDEEKKTVSLDVIVDFDHDAAETREQIRKRLEERFPDYAFGIILDADYSD